MDMKAIGDQISTLRKQKGMTKNDLGERLGVSFQVVSKWERGETLPDTAILLDLAKVLGTSTDRILTGGQRIVNFKGKITVKQMADGICCLEQMGDLLGHDHLIYRHAIEGINEKMNTDMEEAFRDDRIFECLVAEAIIQNLIVGKYIDPTDVKNGFQYSHFRDLVLSYCAKYGII